ncbi:MAG: ubiquinone/menaquinone biosynthesis methyltransferase [Longimicrobiales bacterium]
MHKTRTEAAAGTGVRGMFTAIAPRYDLLNHLLSLNLDRSWRRRAVDQLLAERPAPGLFLDACAGTLDLACELARRPGFDGRVIACDFSMPMLERGVPKTDGLAVAPVCADALTLPLADASVGGATVGFGVRNLSSIDDGLRELARVLRPSAPLVILEFTTPRVQPLRGIYLMYFRRVLPRIGRIVSRHATAYSYLPASVLEFPAPAELAERIERAGFIDVRWERYSAGIVAAHIARRA